MIMKTINAYLHLWFDQKMNHNDVKLENLLFSNDLRFIQLCDFGHTTAFGAELNQ